MTNSDPKEPKAESKPAHKIEEGGICGERGKRLLIHRSAKKGDFDYITSFIIEPIEAITLPEGEELTAYLETIHGTKYKVTFPPDCWSNVQKFMRVLPNRETTFTGKPSDIQQIRDFLALKKVCRKKGKEIAGFHNGKFVTEEGCLSKNGLDDSIIFYIPKSSQYQQENKSYCNLISTKLPSKQALSKIKKTIISFNIPEVALPILGWTVAAFFKPLLMEILEDMGHTRCFPLLNVTGEAGSGKTSTIQYIIMQIWAITISPKSISELTQFTMMRLVSSTNCIPIVFEENKGYMQDYGKKTMISNLIRSTYNGLAGERGKRDQSVQTYYYHAPVVIAGESGFNEAALLDRFVTASMSRKDSGPHLKNFQRLSGLPLEELGKSILNKALSMDKKVVKAILCKELQSVDRGLSDRPRINAAITRFGLRVLENIFRKKEFFDLSKVDKAILDSLSDTENVSVNRKSAVSVILENWYRMSLKDSAGNYRFQDHLEHGSDYEIRTGCLKLYISQIYPIFMKWAKTHSFDGELLPEKTFKKQLRNEHYCLEHGAMKIGGKTRWGYRLFIPQMEEEGLEITDWGKESN